MGQIYIAYKHNIQTVLIVLVCFTGNVQKLHYFLNTARVCLFQAQKIISFFSVLAVSIKLRVTNIIKSIFLKCSVFVNISSN